MRDECEQILRDRGFSVARESFSYSQFPARFGPFVCGSIFALGMYLSGHLASAHRLPLTGIVAALATVGLTAIAGTFLLRRTLTLPWLRADGVNVVATRGSGAPKVWLVAHLDSKSQTIRMLVRVASIGAAWLFFAVTLGTMVSQVAGLPVAVGLQADLLQLATGIAALLSAAAILPVALCFITNDSPGALDNATGVAAVLLSLDGVRPETNLGVLFTSAEELGLAGARAFVASRVPDSIVINCDTIDNDGKFICMTDRGQSRGPLAVAGAAKSIGEEIRVRRSIRGILTDSIPFEHAGWDACTISRGNLGTLSRVHTSGDQPDRIDGAGVALAARILAATVEELS